MELIYAGLVVVLVVVGIGLIIGSLVGGFLPPIVVGVIFLAAAFQEGRLLLFRTACRLVLDETGVMKWYSTIGQGTLAIEEIEQIGRSSRPGVYSFRCLDGQHLDFWLDARDQAVQGFFVALRRAKPTMSTTELYRKGRLWWRGLPAAE